MQPTTSRQWPARLTVALGAFLLLAASACERQEAADVESLPGASPSVTLSEGPQSWFSEAASDMTPLEHRSLLEMSQCDRRHPMPDLPPLKDLPIKPSDPINVPRQAKDKENVEVARSTAVAAESHIVQPLPPVPARVQERYRRYDAELQSRSAQLKTLALEEREAQTAQLKARVIFGGSP